MAACSFQRSGTSDRYAPTNLLALLQTNLSHEHKQVNNFMEQGYLLGNDSQSPEYGSKNN
jgi:hypothetical protein